MSAQVYTINRVKLSFETKKKWVFIIVLLCFSLTSCSKAIKQPIIVPNKVFLGKHGKEVRTAKKRFYASRKEPELEPRRVSYLLVDEPMEGLDVIYHKVNHGPFIDEDAVSFDDLEISAEEMDKYQIRLRLSPDKNHLKVDQADLQASVDYLLVRGRSRSKLRSRVIESRKEQKVLESTETE